MADKTIREQIKDKIIELEKKALADSGKIGHGPNVWIKANLREAKNALEGLEYKNDILSNKEYTEVELKKILDDLNKIKEVDTKVADVKLADRNYRGRV